MKNKKHKISVFTPTFNRAYTLPKLYDSLIRQSEMDFEWLIIDDGSTDDTNNLIESYIQDKKLIIRYYKQENGGKHRAINKGVKLAKGELFFIVDSDDYIVDNALEIILNIYKGIDKNRDLAGLCGLKVYPDLTPLGNVLKFNMIDANAIDIRFKYHIREDLAEVFKTDILREYPFPDIKGENFCPESIVWNRIAQKYKLRYTNEKIYICEFLDDGLTKSSVKNRIKSPKYATRHYGELYSYDIPLKYKVKTGINFWRFAIYRKEKLINLIREIGWTSIPLLPIGLVLMFKDAFSKVISN